MSGLNANKIVAPIDFSDRSDAALHRAVDIASSEGVVEAVYVLLPLSTMEPGNLYGGITDQSRIEAVLKSMRDRFSDEKFARVTHHVVLGDPGSEITAFAERQGADLIVLSSHGYGFLKHLMLGSVAERVVRLAKCPVLVLRS